MSSPESAKPKQPAVLCVQDGARLHYAIPRALEQLGWLERVFTDFLVRPGSLDARIASLGKNRGPLGASRMQERRCVEIQDRVVSYPLRSLLWKFHRKKFAAVEDYYEWLSRQSAQWMSKQNFGSANMAHGFVRNLHPDFCETCHDRGLRTIGDQMIAPAAIEQKEMERQRLRWPSWDAEKAHKNQRLIAFEEKTWERLDHLTCASDYVRDGLVSCGVAAERISVIPYPAPDFPTRDFTELKGSKLLRVGFVGSVNLRKGAPVFLEMARRLKGEGVEFIMVGPLAVHSSAINELQKHVTLAGPVPRSKVFDYLNSFDLFLFPSICEGSAGVVMEALATGLPVVTTPNSGTVVRHGVEGFVHEPDDLDGMEVSLRNLLENHSLREQYAVAARFRSQDYSMTSYQRSMSELLPTLL